MRKLRVAEYSEEFGVSTQAIYKRIKRKTLKTEINNNVKYILVDYEDSQEFVESEDKKNKRSMEGNDEVLILYKDRIKDLEKRLEKSEAKVEEKEGKIETIYNQLFESQNRRLALQEENQRLLLEQHSTEPHKQTYNAEIVPDRQQEKEEHLEPTKEPKEEQKQSEPSKEPEQKDKKKKDKKKSKGEGKRSKFKKKVK